MMPIKAPERVPDQAPEPAPDRGVRRAPQQPPFLGRHRKANNVSRTTKNNGGDAPIDQDTRNKSELPVNLKAN